jgi:nickel-dependent lactate racemase
VNPMIDPLPFPDCVIPEGNLLYSLSPTLETPLSDPKEAVKGCLEHPIGTKPIKELVKKGSRVLILADDMTRPTPQRILLPPLLEALERAGVEESSVQILIALGTHRKMNEKEIEAHFGNEISRRFSIVNHEYDDPKMLVPCGKTSSGDPIVINRRLSEADLVIGISSVVPHAQVGWGGGAKIVLPGVSGEETVSAMHLLAALQPNYPRDAGVLENPVRHFIEEVALKAGLHAILNAVFDGGYRLVQVVFGHPVKAHREGVSRAEKIFLQRIPELADIVLVNAHPADLDYWQGIKPVTLGSLGVKKGGIVILVGRFPDGISPIHDELAAYGSVSKKELDLLLSQHRLHDGVCMGALRQHVLVREWTQVFCVSSGLTPEQTARLGFRRFSSVGQAVRTALEEKGKEAKIGVIDQGGEVVPRLCG